MQETGYSYVELNASATRSKRTLHDEVATHLDCMSLDAFRTKRQVGVVSGRRHALIMDEVDGMAGNEDRGGVQVYNFRSTCACIPPDAAHFSLWKSDCLGLLCLVACMILLASFFLPSASLIKHV